MRKHAHAQTRPHTSRSGAVLLTETAPFLQLLRPVRGSHHGVCPLGDTAPGLSHRSPRAGDADVWLQGDL